MCFKRRMLPGGVCGETVKRKTVEHDIDDDPIDDGLKFKGKTLRKFGDKDYY